MRAAEDIEKSEAGFASGGFCKRTAETHVLFSQANPPVSEKQIKLESERCPPPTAGSWGGAAVAADARWGCGGGRAVLRPLPDVRTATGRCAARAGTGSKASAVQAKPAGAPSAALNPAVQAPGSNIRCRSAAGLARFRCTRSARTSFGLHMCNVSQVHQKLSFMLNTCAQYCRTLPRRLD